MSAFYPAFFDFLRLLVYRDRACRGLTSSTMHLWLSIFSFFVPLFQRIGSPTGLSINPACRSLSLLSSDNQFSLYNLSIVHMADFLPVLSLKGLDSEIGRADLAVQFRKAAQGSGFMVMVS